MKSAFLNFMFKTNCNKHKRKKILPHRAFHLVSGDDLAKCKCAILFILFPVSTVFTVLDLVQHYALLNVNDFYMKLCLLKHSLKHLHGYFSF